MDDTLDTLVTAQYHTTLEILGEGKTPAKLIELGGNLSGYAEGVVKVIGRQLSILPDCTAGCSYCCHQPVSATVPEVLMIADHLRDTRTDEGLDLVRQRAAANIEATRGLADPKLVRQTCPLLEGDTDGQGGVCSAYAVRPSICRCYHSLDVSKCRREYQTPADQTYTIPAFGHTIGGAVMTGTAWGLGKVGLSPGHVNFAVALAIALDNPDAAQDYLDGQPVFEPARMENSGKDKTIFQVQTAEPGWPTPQPPATNSAGTMAPA